MCIQITMKYKFKYKLEQNLSKNCYAWNTNFPAEVQISNSGTSFCGARTRNCVDQKINKME